MVRHQGQMLETTASRHGARRNKVVQRQRIKGTKSTTWTLHSLVDGFGRRVYTVGIIASGSHVLDVVPPLELFEALSASVVDVLGIRDELGRRGRSVGSRHFKWRTG